MATPQSFDEIQHALLMACAKVPRSLAVAKSRAGLKSMSLGATTYHLDELRQRGLVEFGWSKRDEATIKLTPSGLRIKRAGGLL
jgi:hypothetical protein